MRDPRIPLAFATVCVLWSLSWVFIKIGVQDFPPLLFAGIRCIISAGFLFGYARVVGLPANLQSVSRRVNFLAGMFFFGIPFIMIFTGEKTVHASVAAVIFGCSPIFSVTMARIFLGERLSPVRVLAILLGLSGLLYLYLPAFTESGFKANLGLLLILCGALSGSGGMILAKGFLHNENPATSLPHQMILVGPVILAASFALESYEGLHATPAFLVSLGFLSLCSSGIAYLLYFWMLKHMPVAQLVYIDFVYPVLSIIFGHVILDEPVTRRLALAAALIVAGGVLASRSRAPIVDRACG